MMALVRALTAVSLAILIRRSASTAPAAVLGMGLRRPVRTWRAACSASMVSLLPERRRSPSRGTRRAGHNKGQTPDHPPVRRPLAARRRPWAPLPGPELLD